VDALAAWSEQLAGWVIPEHILAAVPDSPWVLPQAVFVRRVDRHLKEPAGASLEMLRESLSPKGTVLDIGAAAGAASLPAADAIKHVIAVDTNESLLAEFAARARAREIPHRVVHGRWPDVAGQVESADVVVCAHVIYNVPDLAPFVHALTAHAARRVLVEIAEVHPLITLNPLWQHFHGITRPDGPTAADAVAALRELGIDPEATRWSKPAAPEYRRFDELVDVTRRRLCLPPDAAAEVADALRGLGVDAETPPDLGSSGRNVVTLAWPGLPHSGI
jgi:SAM-dependent methyltransferase